MLTAIIILAKTDKFQIIFSKNIIIKKAKTAVEIFKIIGKNFGKEKNFFVKNAVIKYIGIQESPTARAEPATPIFLIKITLRMILMGSTTPKVRVRAQI